MYSPYTLFLDDNCNHQNILYGIAPLPPYIFATNFNTYNSHRGNFNYNNRKISDCGGGRRYPYKKEEKDSW